ncbi:MAG: cytochrome c family protein [Congregibacter sp.]
MNHSRKTRYARYAVLLAWTLAALPLSAGASDDTEAAPEASALSALSDKEMLRGKLLFLQCRACHALTAGDNEGKIGPSLNGVMGRTAGSAPYYASYSDALKAAGHEWNRDTMGRWLAGPSAMVPGTSMVFAGISDAGQRDLLLRYLEVVTQSEPE